MAHAPQSGRSPRPSGRRSPNRVGLMGRTALSGATGVFAALALGGGAQAGPTGASVPAAVAKAPGIAVSGSTTDVTLNQPRTIIDWKTFDVSKGDTLNFRFADNGWIVLNRTAGVARIDGALNGCVVTCGNIGGNVWIFGAGGVLFGPNARVNVGSLLATTAPLTSELDFLSGKTGSFTFGGGLATAGVTAAAGAQLAAHGGALALVAPQVETQAGSTVTATGTVLVGAAQTYRIRFDASAGGGMDMLDFDLPASAMEDGTVSATPLAVNGAVSGAKVVLAAVSRPTVMNALISLGGTVTAGSATAGEGGSIVLTASGSDTSKVDVSGSLVAHGGKVDVTAPVVSLEGGIDVSAPSGGGVVRLGGGLRGKDATIANAGAVTVGAEAVIDARATQAGDGGTVTVWSDHATDFHGAILATGGALSGNGGQAEVSGGWLNYAGSTDLRAPRGLTGALLLDPAVVNIIHGTTAGTGTFQGGGPPTTNDPANPTGSTFSVGQINTALANASVTLTATTSINFSEAGGVYAFVGAPGTASTAPANTLTFSAPAFGFAALNPITVTDANLAFSAGANPLSLLTTVTSLVTTGGPLGGVSLTGSALTLSAALTTGALNLTATTGGINASTGTLTAASVAGTAAGAILLTGAANAIGGVGALSATGAGANLTVVSTTALSVTGAASANADVALTGAGLTVATGGSVVGGGNVTLNSTGAVNTLTVGAAVTGGSGAANLITLSSDGGITETLPAAPTPTGVLSATNVSVDARGGAATLTGANLTTKLTQATATGGASFTNAQALNYTAPATTAVAPRTTALALTTTAGALTVSNAIATTSDLSLTSAAALSTAAVAVDGTYAVSAASFATPVLTLTPVAATLPATAPTNFSVTQTAGAFSLATLGTKTVTGIFTVAATNGALTGGGISGGSIALSGQSVTTGAGLALTGAGGLSVTATGGAVSIGAPIATGGNAVILRATTGIGQTAGSTLTAGSLDAQTTGGAVTLGEANAVGTLTNLVGAGASFTDAAGQALTVSAANAGAGALDVRSGGKLTVAGATIGAGGAAFRSTGADVEFQNAVSLSGTTTVNASTNVAFDSTVNGANALTVNPGVAGAATFTGAVGGSTALTSLTVNGAASLNSDITTGSGGLLITGRATLAAPTVGQPTITLTSTGPIALGGADSGTTTLSTLIVRTTDTVSPVAFQSGALGATNGLAGFGLKTAGLGGLATFSATTAAPNRVGLLAISTPLGFTFNNASPTLTIGTLGAGVTAISGITTTTATADVTLVNDNAGHTVGAIAINAPIALGTVASPGSLSLTAGLGITQGASGVFSGQDLAVSARGVVDLTNTGNAFNRLTALTTNGASAASITDSQALTLPNTITVGGPLTLNTTAGGITTGAVTATGALEIDAFAGLTTGNLSGGSVTLNAGGAIGTGTIGGGNISITAGAGLTTGTVTPTGAYTIQATGFNAAALNPVFPGVTTTANSYSVTQTTGNLTLASLGTVTTNGDITVVATNGSVSGTGLNGRSVTIRGTSLAVGGLTAHPRIAGDTAPGAEIVDLRATSGALELTGAVNAPDLLTLRALGGTLTQDPGAIVTAGRLDALASGALTLGLANVVGEAVQLSSTGGAITFVDAASGGLQLDAATAPAGSITVQNSGGVSVTGAVAAAGQTVGLTSTGGAITQGAAGVITAAGLVANGATGVSLATATNVVTTTLSTSVSLNGGAGPVAFRDGAAGAVTISGAGSTGASTGDVSLTNANGLTLTGAVSAGAGRQVTLSATTGAITQSGSGAITATTLSATSGTGATLDTLTNTVTNLALLNGGTGVAAFRTSGALAVTGAVTAGAATGSQAVRLAAGGALTQTAAGVITGGQLTASGSSVALDQAANPIGQVVSLTGATGASLSLGAAGGSTIGVASGGTGALTLSNTGDLALGRTPAGTPALLGTLSAGAGQAVSLTSTAGAISEVASASLTGGSLTAIGAAGVALTAGSNAISTLTRLSDTGGGGVGASYRATGALSVARADSAAGDVALTAAGGALTLTGPVSSTTHTLTLSATGAVNQTGGAVTAGVLTGSGAGFTLGQPGNAVSRLLDVSAGAGRALTLADTVDLTLGGAITGGAVTLSNGPMAGPSSNPGHTITQDAPGAPSNPILTATTLTASATGGLSLTAINAVGTVTSLTNAGSGGVDFRNGTGALSVAAVDAGGGNLRIVTGGALTLTGTLAAGSAAGTQTATISASGAVSQTGGSLVAGTLAGGAGGGFTLAQAGDAYGTLGALTVTGGTTTLVDSAGLTVSGAVSSTGALAITAPRLTLASTGSLAGSSATLTATGASGIALAGPISTLTGRTTLAANAGPIAQTAGTITALELQASAVGGITFTSVATGTIVSLSNSGSGDIGLTLPGAATLGAVSNTGGAVTLADTGGALTFTGAVSARDALSLSARGALSGVSATSTGGVSALLPPGPAVTLTGAGVAFSGAVSSTGLDPDRAGVVVSAGVGSASFGSLSSTAGDVTVTATGTIGVASSLDVGRDLTLTGDIPLLLAGSVANKALAPTFAGTGRDFLLTDTAGGLTYTTLAAPRDLIVVATDPGAGDAAPIAGGALTSTGGRIAVTGTSLSLTGAVSAPAAGVTLTSTAGGIGLSGAVNAGTQTAALIAAGAVTETVAGAIAAGTLSVASNGAITLAGANAVPTVTSLVNAGAGGVRFNDTAGAVSIATVTTVGGDIGLSAPNGALTLTTALTSPGALTVSSGGLLTAPALMAQGGALSATGVGVTLTGDATASSDLTVAAGTGAASLQRVTATGGGLTLSGASLGVGAASAGTSATIISPGAVALTTLTAGTTLSVGSGALTATSLTATAGSATVTAASIDVGTVASGTATSLTGAGLVHLTSATAGTDLAIASGTLQAATLTATGGALTLSGASLDVGASTAGTTATLTSAGPVTLGTLTAGTGAGITSGALTATTLTVTTGPLTVYGSTLNIQNASSGGVTSLTGTGMATLGRITAGTNLTVASGMAATQATTLTATAGALDLSGAALDVATAQAGTTATLNAPGVVNLGTLTAGTNANITSGALTATTLTTGGALTVGGTTLAIQTASSGGATSLTGTGLGTLGTVTAGTDLTVATGAGALQATTLTATGGALTLSGASLAVATSGAGAAATLTSTGPVTLGTLTAATDASISSGALTATTLTATGGALTVSATTLDIQTASSGGSTGITGTGLVTLGTATAGTDLTVASGLLQGTTLTATAGALDLSGSSLNVTTAVAGTTATLTSAGPVTLGALTAQTDLSIASGTLTATTLAATGGDLTLRTADATLGTATAGGVVDAQATGALQVTTLGAGAGLAASSGAGLTAGTVTAGQALSLTAANALQATTVTATAGSATLGGASVNVGTVSTGTDASLTSTGGDLTLATATTGRDLTLASAGALSATTVTVGRNLTASGPTTVAIGAITAGATGALTISGQDVTLGAAAGATPAAGQALVTGAGVTTAITATRDLVLNLAGPATVTSLTATRDLTFATTGGDAVAGSVSAGGALSVAANGGSARVGSLTVTGAGPAAVRADTDVVLGQGFAGATLSVPAALLTVSAGRDVAVAYPGDISLASVAAGRRVLIASAGGQVTVPTVTATTGDVSVTAAGIALGTVTAGGSISAIDPGGDATIDMADFGGDLTLTSSTGNAAVRDLRARGTESGTRTIAVTALGQATIGRTSDTAPTGALALDDAARTKVSVRSTGSTGGAARVDVSGGATLSEVSSASGDVIVKAGGAVNGVPAGSALFTANKALSVTAAGDITMGGASTAGATATIDAQGTLTLAALTAPTITLRATDLTLNGDLVATAPAGTAPALSIESRSGPLILGAPPSGAPGTPSGGMTIDSTELGHIRGATVALYAGDTTDSTKRGDVAIGDLTFDGSKIGKLSVLAGPAATVTVSGVVSPAAANVGDLVIGGAKSADGWTPKSIYVEGALGTPGTGVSHTGNAALRSVELNAINDVLIGGRTFVAAITGVETPDRANAISVINITRGIPIGVQTAVADLNRNIVTAGTLTLRSDGYIVQQNTGASGQQGGVLLTNPDKAQFVLTLGRVGGLGVGGSLTPALIDVQVSFFNAAGTLLNRQVAAASPAVDIGELTRSDAYRINGCTIGTAGTCTPLPNTIVDIRINKLVEGVQIASEDPPAIDDPTITGAGNEEIWRSPSCIPGQGRDCK